VGLRLPTRWEWLFPLPVVLVAALAGGVWIAPSSVGLSDPASLVTLLLLPLLAELVFRGIAHGILCRGFSVQHAPGRWLISWPAAISAVFFALWTLPLWGPPLSAAGLVWRGAPLVVPGIAALVAGLGFGVARERSGSLLAPIILHYLGVIAVLVAVAL
jgi:membrane protease YdiL (CAAX protease family)